MDAKEYAIKVICNGVKHLSSERSGDIDSRRTVEHGGIMRGVRGVLS